MRALTNSFQRFFKLETSGSIVLLACAVIAIFISNGAFSTKYFTLLQSEFTIGFGEYILSKPILLWINDGLMAIFFFVVGLEIKREIIYGELSTFKQAMLPVFAAIGGMFVPIAIFLIVNNGGAGSEGWGIPMATDIAFSLGVLMLLGKRVPVSLKVFLTAFAIVDDIGGVLVITFFYSSTIMWKYIIIAFALYAILLIFNSMNRYSKYAWTVMSIIIWVLFLKSGIHPTIAGIIIAFTIPANRKINCNTFADTISPVVDKFRENQNSMHLLTKPQIESIGHIEELTDKVQPRLQYVENKMHGWVVWLIMPIFAMANCGVVLFNDQGNISAGWLSFSIAAALLLGNTIGIPLFSWIAVKLKLAVLPKGIKFKHLIAVGLLGGIGFTMSLFINSLAFTDAEIINQAKIGIIAGSLVSGILGFFVLKRMLRDVPVEN
ncbi:MAG: Na+/H+ antiporter NhaA [Bacteroidales bacterium]|jgi:NhaA family Na+:H+ antiporter|nr:Na+/H+ antiporter NhaA [Bacteroidales bacterium]